MYIKLVVPRLAPWSELLIVLDEVIVASQSPLNWPSVVRRVPPVPSIAVRVHEMGANPSHHSANAIKVPRVVPWSSPDSIVYVCLNAEAIKVPVPCVETATQRDDNQKCV